MAGSADGAFSSLEYHVMLAMAREPLYGYAIADAVDTESSGALTPRPGTLYRVLARLMVRGLVEETGPDESLPPHPGRERRYYALSGGGRAALAAEARRLKEAAALAEERLGAVEGRS